MFCDLLSIEEYESIKDLLVEIAPRENSSQVNRWNTGGQIYLDYIKLWEKFNDIKVRATLCGCSNFFIYSLQQNILTVLIN
jgi:hypothetical protein